MDQSIMNLVFLFALVFVENCASTDIHSDTNSLMISSKPVRSLSPGMWFGPRLGRRLKRNPKDLSGAANKEQLSSLMELIQDSPWVVLAMNEGKRQAMNFTPRLGRESGEESDQGVERYLQDPEFAVVGDAMAQRSPPFAPRLGRRLQNGYNRFLAYI